MTMVEKLTEDINFSRPTREQSAGKKTWSGWSCRALLFLATLTLCPWTARAESPVQAFTDNTDYNAGSVVQLNVLFKAPGSALPATLDVKATVRYAGETKPVLDKFPLLAAYTSAKAGRATGYRRLWAIPSNARTGRYEIDLTGLDSKSHQTVFTEPNAASFVVFKKLVRIEGIKLDKTFYTSGDPVTATFTVVNVSHAPLTGLRVEFSNRYWPWIAGPTDAAKASVVTLDKNLSLPVGGGKSFHAAHVETADDVKQPATHQYGVVVWDHARKTVLDISFSPLAFFQPPGVTEPKPFSGWYLYPELSKVNTESYRHFYPAGMQSAAIQFDHSHTMFAAGSDVEAKFSVSSLIRGTSKGVAIRSRILSPSGEELSTLTAKPVPPSTSASLDEVTIRAATAADASGLYRAEIEVLSAAGDVMASDSLEMGVNPMPKSILIFCAHEDDEGGYSGLTRAAIENHIPIHYVYFTSGDAGSCDVYYQHSCAPADALNFGSIRMDEVRASLGHLGVPREDILFIGLPDGGSGMIWYDHLAAVNPFLDPLLATDHAPYDALVAPNLPYARDAVIETVKSLIRKFQPDVIGTPHPGSVGHIDHIVNNYFVVKALQALLREGAVASSQRVWVSPVYDPKTQPKTPYQYKDVEFHISGDVAAMAQESGWFYMSQGGSRGQGNIQPFDKLPRVEKFRQMVDWSEHEGWNEKRAAASQ